LFKHSALQLFFTADFFGFRSAFGFGLALGCLAFRSNVPFNVSKRPALPTLVALASVRIPLLGKRTQQHSMLIFGFRVSTRFRRVSPQLLLVIPIVTANTSRLIALLFDLDPID